MKKTDLLKKTTAAFVPTLMAASLSLAAMPALAADYDFNIVHLSNTSDEDYDGAVVLKDYVEAQSNGRIHVNIYSGGQLCGNPTECIEALQANLIQVFNTTTGGLSNVFPEIQALDIPYIFPTDRVAECALNNEMLVGPIRKELLDRTGTMRLMTIGNTGGWRNFATTNKLIKTPADVKGLKIRTINSPIQMQLVKAMGGSPTAVPWPEVYTSLATGLVEGTKNGITDIMGMKFNEHIKYMTLDGHGYMASMWWMNNDSLKDMPEDLQHIMMDGFDALREVTTVMPKRRQIEAYNEFKASGGTVYAPTAEEKAQFQEAAKPVRAWFVNEYGAKWVETTENAVKSCEASIDEAYMAQN
ncbi:TRAP transporter substrate-binding protein DctP [Marinomonas polaris]|uniref:TRAP-type C4-dicarboxylate transport system, substrate-binding protein n=1 Tax=Marinomonas polaris DSM 16579 TaxID=1122206 RepID=A0A1M4YE98_9GAMM|nr:TRAP transporter substrate-binding protein DctP [Marinomonas polaris]SHF04049.1 TRAP-type C4-dicarboxylate transport system, substrate-binding protein [Marinomonas polaris DSM 16579]